MTTTIQRKSSYFLNCVNLEINVVVLMSNAETFNRYKVITSMYSIEGLV